MRDHIERYRVGNIATTQAALIGVSPVRVDSPGWIANRLDETQ